MIYHGPNTYKLPKHLSCDSGSWGLATIPPKRMAKEAPNWWFGSMNWPIFSLRVCVFCGFNLEWETFLDFE